MAVVSNHTKHVKTDGENGGFLNLKADGVCSRQGAWTW